MTRSTFVLAAVALLGGFTTEVQAQGRVRLRDRPFFTDPLPTYPSGYATGRTNFGANPENAVMYPGYGLGASNGGPGYTYRGYHSYSPSYGYGQSGIGFGPVWGGGYGLGWGMGISPYNPPYRMR
jgi:hypothetical protein